MTSGLEKGRRMASPLSDRLSRWVKAAGIDARGLPSAAETSSAFESFPDACRPGIARREITSWERRHGYRLPPGLRAWLAISNGFYSMDGPLIHPLSAIGPMVPFASQPDVVVQPESWFELGNPNVQTICIDLAYPWPIPGGGPPIFTSGDDQTRSRPRLIATSFESWFLEVVRRGGREYWFEPGFQNLGDPWEAHKRYAPAPPLPDRLRALAPFVLPLMHPGADDRFIATSLGISRNDLEALFRHLQHGHHGFAGH